MIRNYICIYSIRDFSSVQRFLSWLSELFFHENPLNLHFPYSFICFITALQSPNPWFMQPSALPIITKLENLWKYATWPQYTFTVSQAWWDLSLLSIPCPSKASVLVPQQNFWSLTILFMTQTLPFLSHTPTQLPTSYSYRLLKGATLSLSILI